MSEVPMTQSSPAQGNNSTGLPNITKLGSIWQDRIEVSERWFRANSYDWDALYSLYGAVYDQRSRWGSSVSIAWSIIQNIVEDSVPALPEPWIMPRRTDGNPDLPKMLRDLAKTIHKHCDTKDILKRARILCAYSSMPCIWPHFRQVSIAVDQNGQPIAGDDEQGDDQGQQQQPEVAGFMAKEQIVALDLRSGWDMRYDQNGRNWDLSDHKWIGAIYTRTLQDCLDDPDLMNKDLLARWARNRYMERRGDTITGGSYSGSSAYSAGYQEKDYRYWDIELIEIWSRVEHKIITKPNGARFHVGEWDWPDEWAEADVFPAVPVAINWEGDDRRGKKGFYSIPDLRLIRSQLENLNRLEGLYLDVTTQAVKKYFYPDGIFDDKAFTKIQSDVNREFIGIDWKLLKSKLGVATGEEFNPGQVDLRSLIMLMPQESREEALKHAEAIEHELEMIYEILGQSPADRGGALAVAKSATQAIQIGQGQQRRLTAQAEQLAEVVDRVTERIFILLKEHQTLPIHYLTTGDYMNESTWQTFLAEDLSPLDLVFYHHAGSSQPIDRDTYRFEVREVITQLMPLIINGGMSREAKFLVHELLSTYDIPGIDKVFADVVPDLVKQVMAMLDQIQNGAVDATDPNVAVAFVEAVSQLVGALASPADVQQVAQATMQGQNNVVKMGGPTQQSPLRAARSRGQVAAASAASGAVGGLS